MKRLFLRLTRPAKSGAITIKTVTFQIDLELDRAMADMYHGLYEPELIRALHEFLPRGGTFFDIGANVGYVSAHALACVGNTGSVYSFEPVPQYFDRLRQLNEDNPDLRFFPFNLALGDKDGTATICVTSKPNIGWNTLVPGFMPKDETAAEIEVQVTTLDSFATTHQINRIDLLKIDTEGFEFPVLEGMQNTIRTMSPKPIIIVEVAPAAYEAMGIHLHDLRGLVEKLGYQTLLLDSRQNIDITSLSQTTNVLLLPGKTEGIRP